MADDKSDKRKTCSKEIEEVLEYFFEKVDCKVFGLAKKFSLYRYYECHSPIIERCSNFISCK